MSYYANPPTITNQTTTNKNQTHKNNQSQGGVLSKQQQNTAKTKKQPKKHPIQKPQLQHQNNQKTK